jgi:hypothetical protein
MVSAEMPAAAAMARMVVAEKPSRMKRVRAASTMVARVCCARSAREGE